MQSSTQEYILKYLTILEKNLKLYKKRIPLQEIVEMLCDLNDMFN